MILIIGSIEILIGRFGPSSQIDGIRVVNDLVVRFSGGIVRRNVKVPVAANAIGRSRMRTRVPTAKTGGGVQIDLIAEIFVVIGGTDRSLPVRILDPGYTVTRTSHMAVEESIKAVKIRIIRGLVVSSHDIYFGTWHALIFLWMIPWITLSTFILGVMKACGIGVIGVYLAGHHVAFEAALAGTEHIIYCVKVNVAGTWNLTSICISRGV
jgi:hypothetical protein